MLALLWQQPAVADSAKMTWNDQGHLRFYQRFDSGAVTWDIANKACEDREAHLATITSQEEQTFVHSFVNKSTTGSSFIYYWLGATDGTVEGRFRWLTGERFGPYTNWDSNEPNTEGQSYLSMYTSNGEWEDLSASSSSAKGFVCAWGTSDSIDTTSVPDLNRNGSSEIAVLYVDYVGQKHTVLIKGPKRPRAEVAKLRFHTSEQPPVGLAVLQDINGNGAPEIGVLYLDGTQPKVWSKDAKTGGEIAVLSFFGRTYLPKSITVGPDVNSNGVEEITVLGIAKATGNAATETRDGKTGEKLGKNLSFVPLVP